MDDPGIPVRVFGGRFGRLILICWSIPSMVCGYSQPCCDTCPLGPETNYIRGHPKIAVHPNANTMFNSTSVFAFGCFKVMSSYMLDSNKIVHSTCCRSGKMQQSEKETEESLAQLKYLKSWRVWWYDSHRGTFRLITVGCSVEFQIRFLL